MNDYELSVPSLSTIMLIGGACVAALFFLWKRFSKPRLEPDRRQRTMKVEVERRKGERRKYPRYQHT